MENSQVTASVWFAMQPVHPWTYQLPVAYSGYSGSARRCQEALARWLDLLKVHALRRARRYRADFVALGWCVQGVCPTGLTLEPRRDGQASSRTATCPSSWLPLHLYGACADRDSEACGHWAMGAQH